MLSFRSRQKLLKGHRRGDLYDIRAFLRAEIKNTAQVELDDDFDNFQFMLNCSQPRAAFETKVSETTAEAFVAQINLRVYKYK